jgi:hypothetical protein
VYSDDTIPVAVGRTEPERTIDDGVADADQARKVKLLREDNARVRYLD